MRVYEIESKGLLTQPMSRRATQYMRTKQAREKREKPITYNPGGDKGMRWIDMALARTEGDVVARAKVIAAMDAWEAKLVAKFGAAQVKTVLYEDCE